MRKTKAEQIFKRFFESWKTLLKIREKLCTLLKIWEHETIIVISDKIRNFKKWEKFEFLNWFLIESGSDP